VSTASSQHTFTLICLVSKRFLHLARSRLYSRPFPASLTADWSTASALLASLVKRRGYLGTLVRSLNGLISYIGRLSRYPLGSFRDVPAIFVWYIAILQACPNIIELDLTFNNRDRLAQILQVLRRPNPNLCSVHFANPYGGGRQAMSTTEQLAQTALQDPLFRSIEKLSLQSLERADSDPPSYPPLDLRLKSLSINESCRVIPRPCPVSLVDASALTHFDLVISDYSIESLSLYLTPLPSTLEHIVVNIVRYHETPHISSYAARSSEEIRLPIDTFSPFPYLRSLTLRHFPGPTLSLLRQIVKSCTGLVKIDLTGCVWILDNLNTADGEIWEDYCHAVFPFVEIYRELIALQSLSCVHLGNVPAEDQI